MIELLNDQLVFSFPEVHPSAKLTVSFQRTLRIPDDGSNYPLPPGLGSFPMRHVDDFRDRVPASWTTHGGVMLPMYQSEAMWLSFSSGYDDDRETSYPFAIKVATGKINAVSGQPWQDGLHRRPQDYLSVPTQPWLDGFCVEKGVIRQFVAMPLGSGYSAEEQITGEATHGGLQLQVWPMTRKAYERHFPKRRRYSTMEGSDASYLCCCEAPSSMGLAPGGRMKQEIYDDPYAIDEWETSDTSRCFVHLANSLTWRQITGDTPPTTPFTAIEYTRAGLPWFDWYDDNRPALDGAAPLAGLKSVSQRAKEKGDMPLPENETVTPDTVVSLGPKVSPNRVTEWQPDPC